MLAFPTSEIRPCHAGYPIRADGCHCTRGPVVIRGEDTCLWCGHHPRHVITRTWTMRARLLAERSQRRAAA